jgi:hypothetical protein
MRTLSAVLVVSAGFSLWSCSDESSGPGVGPDTSWQLSCASPQESGDCGSTGTSPHGPVGGTDAKDTHDDEDIQVECSLDSGGYAIKLTDPGRPMTDPNNPNNKARGPSVLTITKGAVKGNKCFVDLEDSTTGGTHYHVKDACTGVNDLMYDGSCTLTGSAHSNGYDFDGAIQCTGMRVNGAGPADYRVGQARALSSPVKLQIKHCN